MTHQHSMPGAEKDDLLRIVNALTVMTVRLSEATKNDDFDSVERLTAERSRGIATLEECHRNAIAPEDEPGTDGEELRQALTALQDASKELQDTIREKSSSIVTALEALQSNRYYENRV